MTIQNNTLFPSGPLQLKGGTAQAMQAANPLLARREIAVEFDTGKIKVGNGSDYWNDLPYSSDEIFTPFLSFNKASLDLILTSRKTDTFTFFAPRNLTASVRSSDESVATASVDGNIVTVNAVNSGHAVIFVHVAFDGYDYTINGFVPVEVRKAVRYGYRIKKDEADPFERVEYLYDAVGLTPAHMDFVNGVFDYGDWGDKWFVTQNKPCMLNFDGSVDYYLDPNDYSKKEDGSDSDVSNTAYEGNAMAQIPLCWVKRYEEDGYEYEIVSDVQFDDDYKAYAHTRADGSIADFFYWSMFGASGDTTKLRSLSGVDLGRGLFTTGTLNDKGQFFGYNSNSLQVKVFHIEKFWGDQWDRTAGLISNYGSIFVKMTPENEGYSINDVNGYTDTGITLTGTLGGYISEGSMSEFGFIPTIFCGSDATYYCDLTEFNAGLVAYLNTGGSAGTSSAQGGAFALSMGSSPSLGHGNIGCGLSCLQPAAASSEKESDNP